MKNFKAFSVLILALALTKIHAQDTIFSDAYPKGVVVPSIDMNDYESRLHPIDNPTLKLIIPKKQLIKITNNSGTKYVNQEYTKSNDVVIPVDPSTGKVNYVGIIEVPGANKKTLFNALKTLPSSNVQYALISSDETDNTFLQYTGKFNTKFAGDLYDVIFSLTIKFKDGKIKYDFHDFMFCFEEIKQKNRGDLGGSYSIATRYKVSNPLEKFYVPGYRGDKFWKTIYNSMEEAVKAVNKTCKDFASDKDGF